MPVEKQRKRGIKPSPLHTRLLAMQVGETTCVAWDESMPRRVQAQRLRTMRTYIQNNHGWIIATKAREAGIEVRRLR